MFRYSDFATIFCYSDLLQYLLQCFATVIPFQFSRSMDPMCMEAALSLSYPVEVSSTSTSQVGLNTVSGMNSSSRVVPLASGGVGSLVGEPIPPQPERGVSMIVPDSVTGLIQSSTPLVQGGKSFAGFFKSSPVETLPVPSVPSKKGGYVSVRVDPIAYQARLELCRNALIGRVVLSSGERPWKLMDLKARLSKHWMLNSDWRLISLGRGYYQILLKSPVEKNHVWGLGSVHLKPGILRLQPWVPDFNPSLQKSTNAQVWVRLFDLSWEYWHPKIISDLARGIGVPLRLDKATSDGDFGHYARVLVDVDVSSVLPTTVLLERDEFHSSFIAVEYENLPAFCSTCSSIGHLPSSCRWNKSSKVPLTNTAKSTQDIAGDSRVFGDDGFQPVRTRSSKSVYRPVIAPQEEVPLSNVFSAIHQDVGGQDSVVVHTSVGSNLISGSTSSAGLVLSSDPSSSTVSAISRVVSSSVPPMISQALQVSKGSGLDGGVTDSVLVCSSSVVDPSISSVSSAVGVVHDSRAVVQSSSVVNQFRPVVSTILSRSSSRPGLTARRQVRVQEEVVVSSTPNVNVDLSSLRDGSGFSCSSVVDPRVQIQSSGPLSESHAELRLIADSSWASQVEEGELADAEVAQRTLRVERRLASLKSGYRAPPTVSND